MKLEEKDQVKHWDPPGYRVLIKIKEVEETSTGGIIIPESTRDRYDYTTGEGIVVKMGPDCFQGKAFPSGQPWCKPGDHVMFTSYSGCLREMYENDKLVSYRIINDNDILLVKESKDD